MSKVLPPSTNKVRVYSLVQNFQAVHLKAYATLNLPLVKLSLTFNHFILQQQQKKPVDN